MSVKYSVVVPVYNEEEVVFASYERLTKVMKQTEEPYEIIFVNDGSRDKSSAVISEICKNDPCIKSLNFSRNFGHQPAITAGMDYASGEAIVVIDSDLQDPPEVILDMITEWKNGYEVVYGKRIKRKGETLFKKITAKIYYRLLKSMTNVDIPTDTGDFRLIDRKVCEAMKSLNEKNRYVRGLVSWVGFKQKPVEYVREERFAGETKYPLRKMIKLAVDGITAFSYKPLKLTMSIGFIISFFSFLYLIVIICQKFFGDQIIAGWASTMAIMLFSQGIVLIMLGIIGEYIGRIFEEIKGRPNYIISEKINFADEDETIINPKNER